MAIYCRYALDPFIYRCLIVLRYNTSHNLYGISYTSNVTDKLSRSDEIFNDRSNIKANSNNLSVRLPVISFYELHKDNSRPSSRPSRAAAAQSNSNSAISGADEPRSRIIRGDNGEIVEFRYETGESYKGK